MPLGRTLVHHQPSRSRILRSRSLSGIARPDCPRRQGEASIPRPRSHALCASGPALCTGSRNPPSRIQPVPVRRWLGEDRQVAQPRDRAVRRPSGAAAPRHTPFRQSEPPRSSATPTLSDRHSTELLVLYIGDILDTVVRQLTRRARDPNGDARATMATVRRM